MPFTIKVTNAGRIALVNAENNGTAPVTISEIGVSETEVTPDPAATALTGELKRVSAISGEVVSDDTMHVTMFDDSGDAYSMRSFAVYLADGTLFAIYGQTDPVIEKTASSIASLAVDIRFVDVDAASVTFGDTTFSNPPATTERQGVVELATVAEAQAGIDALRALTPASARAAVLAWIIAQDGAGSGIDADLLDGQHGGYYADIPARLGYTPLNAATYTGANILSKLLPVDGPGSGLDADLLDGVQGSAYVRIVASSISANGGYRIYSDGFRECWGTLAVPGNASDYPVSFPAACNFTTWSKTFIEGPGGTGNAQDNGPSVKSSGLSSFLVEMGRDNPVAAYWWAKGY